MKQVHDARFVGLEGHLEGTERIYNAAGYPPDLRRPQGTEPAINGSDRRPRCFTCRKFGHFAAGCRVNIITKLTKGHIPPRNVYLNHERLATNAPLLLATLAPTPHPEVPPSKHQQQQHLQQYSFYERPHLYMAQANVVPLVGGQCGGFGGGVKSWIADNGAIRSVCTICAPLPRKCKGIYW